MLQISEQRVPIYVWLIKYFFNIITVYNSYLT